MGPNQSLETTQNTPYQTRLSLAWFWVAIVMFLRPQFLPIPIPLHKSISQIWEDLKSHIWGLWGPHQTPKFTQNKSNRATFPLAWFLMLKIMLQQPQFVPITNSPHKSVSPISKDPKSLILVYIVGSPLCTANFQSSS